MTSLCKVTEKSKTCKAEQNRRKVNPNKVKKMVYKREDRVFQTRNQTKMHIFIGMVLQGMKCLA